MGAALFIWCGQPRGLLAETRVAVQQMLSIDMFLGRQSFISPYACILTTGAAVSRALLRYPWANAPHGDRRVSYPMLNLLRGAHLLTSPSIHSPRHTSTLHIRLPKHIFRPTTTTSCTEQTGYWNIYAEHPTSITTYADPRATKTSF